MMLNFLTSLPRYEDRFSFSFVGEGVREDRVVGMGAVSVLEGGRLV